MVIALVGAVSVSALTGITNVRLWGADRYKTSVRISREGWESSRYVLLATGTGDDKFADALAGAPLAGALNAPVLLTESSSLSMDTRQEIERLKPNKVFILGGTGVISENVKSEILNMGITVERLSGNDRYGTAAKIAEALKLIKTFSKAVITTGSEFQYAMMIAPFAARDNLPVLFTMQDSIPDQTKDALKNLGINEIEIIGNYNIVSGSVEDKLWEMGISVTRISGESISETNINVIKQHMLFPHNISIARDDLFADALSGVPYAAKNNAPIMLVGSNLMSIDILNFLSTLSLEKVFVFGGPGAISDNVISSIHSKNTVNQLYGLNFGPYMDGQDPNLGAAVSESQIRSRMEIIAPYTRWIRTYGCTGGLENSGAIAHELGLKAAVGAWIGKDKEANRLEISSLINEIKSGHADMAIVGNETLLRGDISEAELISLIKEVKDASKEAGFNIPVSTVETYGELLKRPNLMNACDVVLANYHPYWEGLDIDSAVSSFEGMYTKIKSASDVKTVIFSEIGWPDDGNAKGSAVPTAQNAKKFFNEFILWAQNNNIPYFYFEAFDENWKANYEGDVGSHWGIWNSKGDIKFDITPILNQPTIEFTNVPPIGSFDNLMGRTANINPDDYIIAVYIKVSGSWWIKPYSNTPLTNILPDGTWSCDITTGGIDSTATSVAAFLIPESFSPPLLLGVASLPDALHQNSIAKIIIDR